MKVAESNERRSLQLTIQQPHNLTKQLTSTAPNMSTSAPKIGGCKTPHQPYWQDFPTLAH